MDHRPEPMVPRWLTWLTIAGAITVFFAAGPAFFKSDRLLIRLAGLLCAGRHLGRVYRFDDVVHAEGAEARTWVNTGFGSRIHR